MLRRLAIVLVGLACAGCAATGYSASSLQRQLQSAGLTERQARCVTVRLEDRFKPNRLSAHVEPTSTERAKARAVLRSCGVRLRS